MKLLALTYFFVLMFSVSNLQANEEARVRKQNELDKTCETAREKKLVPLRQQFIVECVEEQEKERAYCIRLYNDYGAKAGNRAPLFYDLPECVAAFEYQRSYRQAR